MTNLILAAKNWATNSELIADVHHLGYIADTDHVIDPTYGEGNWWTTWRPANLTTHHRNTDATDFRRLPHPAGTFDVAAYDPPYVCPGGRKTSTVQAFHDRYGMNAGGAADPDFRTPAELQQLMDDGLTEMVRIVRPRGLVLMKCKDYVWSGRVWWGTDRSRAHATTLGCTVVDRFEFIGEPGPQSQTTQVHARRNLSTLFVFRTPKRPPAPELFG